MSKIALDGFKPVNNQWPVSILDTRSGEVATTWFEDQKDGIRAGYKSGEGDFRTVALLGVGHQGFVGVYATDDRLHIWLDGVDVIVDSSVRITRSTDWLLRQHFKVTVNGCIVFQTKYWHVDHEDVPDTDIFLSMSRNLSDLHKRTRMLLMLSDKANGTVESTDSYFHALTARVKDRLQS